MKIAPYLPPHVSQLFVRFSASFFGIHGKAFAYILYNALGLETKNPDYRPRTADEIQRLVDDHEEKRIPLSGRLWESHQILCMGEDPPKEVKNRQFHVHVPKQLQKAFLAMCEQRGLPPAKMAENLIFDFFSEEPIRKDGLNSGAITLFENLYDHYGFKELPEVGELHGIFGDNPLIPLLDMKFTRDAYVAWKNK